MEATALKDIALKQKHIDMGAKMVPFAWFNMPLQYTGLTDEHRNVRNDVGVFSEGRVPRLVLFQTRRSSRIISSVPSTWPRCSRIMCI